MGAAVRTVRATGAEAVELLLSQSYVTRLRTRGERPALSLTNSIAGPLSLGRATFDLVGDLRGDRPGVIGIGRVRTGRLSYAYASQELRWTTGDLFIAVNPGSDYVLHVEKAQVDHTMIDVGVLVQIVEPPSRQSLCVTGHAPVSPQAAATWLRTWSLVNDIVTGTSLPASGLVVGQAARMLAAVTLASFPNNAVLEPTVADRHDAHPAAMRRAISFIEANPDLDLTVVDVARAAHVSTRALQLAFRRHLDTTPMAYLRRVRLDRAHADLLAAAPGAGATVTHIAFRWGWARPSRFAADYRAAYGAYPRQVLRDER